MNPLVKYAEVIQSSTIDSLIESLNCGFPIPGKKIDKYRLKEKPTFVQEILFSAWMYRNQELKQDVLKKIPDINIIKTQVKLKESFREITALFRRFDQSILRSIQVSEWFDILEDDNEDYEIDSKTKTEDGKVKNNSSVLVDTEIYELLKNNELKIIPIISLEKQLGSTSFDIRLGTSFQIYLLTKYGETNYQDNQINGKVQNSKMIDLDFLDSITISPGQFILGHSMEYLKLPTNIAGQVEGRSSFARLGLQVHMTASFIDPGFEGVLTFEISNTGPNPITLFPGVRIAQVRFLSISKPFRPYNRNLQAKYRGMLTHHDSKQFKDYEMIKIYEEIRQKNMC